MPTRIAIALVVATALLVYAQEPEPLGDTARRVRAEKNRSTSQSDGYDDATYNKNGTINAARLYNEGMNALIGDPLRRADALNLLRDSADLGYAPAQVVLGYVAETYKPVNYSSAADWYRKAAQSGDPLAQWLLGRAYLTGSGVSRDLTQARKWLLPAAENGDPIAQYLMGMSLDDRPSESADWFRKAAERSLPQAQKSYGLLLEDGVHVKKDRYGGYVWLLAAMNNGVDVPSSLLATIESSLRSTQVQQAKTEARAISTRAAAAKGCTGWPGEFDNIPATPPPELHRYCR